LSDIPKFPALDVSIERNLPPALDFNLNPSQGALFIAGKAVYEMTEVIENVSSGRIHFRLLVLRLLQVFFRSMM
jgi:hypothetical protein